MALDVLASGDMPANPATSPLNAASPLGSMPVTSAAIDNLRSDVAIQNPDDAFNKYLMSMIPSAAQMAQSKAQVIAAQQAQAAARDQNLQYLQGQFSPEHATALNWQTIGNAGAAMLANPSNPWGAGATTQMQGITNNRADMSDAQAKYEAAKLANATSDTAAMQDQYKMELDQQKEGIKGLLDYRKEALKNRGTNVVMQADQIGRIWAIDKVTRDKVLVLDSNGLTQQDTASIGDLRNKLIQQYGSNETGLRIVKNIIDAKIIEIATANRAAIGAPDASEAPPAAAPVEAPQSDIRTPESAGHPYTTIEGAGQPRFTPEEQATIAADFKKTRPDGEAGFDLFTPEELQGVKLQPPVGADELTQKTWADMQQKATTEALKDEEAARATLSQVQAMSESAKAALALGAKTSALQPFINNFGNVLSALGLEGGLSKEAVKGQTFDAIKNQAVQVLQNAAKGAQTEGDAKRFAESLVQVKNTAEANKLIAKFMEAQVWKRRAEIDFRSKYNNIPEQAPAGASAKWQDWSASTPLIQRIKGTPVFVQDFINHMVQDNPKIVEQYGVTYVKREALKEWRKLQN